MKFIIRKNYKEVSVFNPEKLLREARRQKGIKPGRVPDVCILDPDGDIVRYLKKKNLLKKDKYWACYHTDLHDFKYKDIKFGIIGCVVSSSYAVLVAEELFISGCKLLISMTSAGKIDDKKSGPRFILIEKAIRDEGTSFHYAKPESFSCLDKMLLRKLKALMPDMETGVSWTTDAPFRETKTAIESARKMGAIAVEMEASALYAFSKTKNKKIICFAHLTNSPGKTKADFEKGLENGSIDSLALIYRAAKTIF